MRFPTDGAPNWKVVCCCCVLLVTLQPAETPLVCWGILPPSLLINLDLEGGVLYFPASMLRILARLLPWGPFAARHLARLFQFWKKFKFYVLVPVYIKLRKLVCTSLGVRPLKTEIMMIKLRKICTVIGIHDFRIWEEKWTMQKENSQYVQKHWYLKTVTWKWSVNSFTVLF